MASYHLTSEEELELKNILSEFIEDKNKNELDFTKTKYNVHLLSEALEDLGFSEDGFESNGYAYDFWVPFSKDKMGIFISGQGLSFELKLIKN